MQFFILKEVLFCLVAFMLNKFFFELSIICSYSDYIEGELVEFARRNPGIAIYLHPRLRRAPTIRGEYCMNNILIHIIK